MSITLSTLCSKTPTKCFPPRISHCNNSFPLISSSLTANAKPLTKLQSPHNFYGPFKKYFNGFQVKSCGFLVKAQNDSGFSNDAEKEDMEARRQNSLPERFRFKEVYKPIRWPWLIVLAFMLYTWRDVLRELSMWKWAFVAICNFLGYKLKWAPGAICNFLRYMLKRAPGPICNLLGYISKLPLTFHFIGNLVTSVIRGVNTTLYPIWACYSGIIKYAPIPELTTIITLTSSVLAVAQTTVPDSVNSQPYILTVAGLIGFAAVSNYISELFFWTLLVGLFGFGRFVKKRDYVSSGLPVAAVLAAVGEPWVRIIAMGSYLGLAIFQHSSNSGDLKEDEVGGVRKRVPFPLLCAALAIGVRVAAKWARYRHLTWMVA